MALLLFKKLVFGDPTPSGVSTTTAATEAIAAALRRDSDASVATVTNLEAQPLLPGRMGAQKRSFWDFQLNARVISDATIGLADGLTVPFALTAGLSTLGSTRTVWLAGLAELVAGAISMGLGGWLGAKSELESYKEKRREIAELIASDPTAIAASIQSTFAAYFLPASVLEAMIKHLSAQETDLATDFITRFEHGQEEPATSRALTSAFTIALGYFLGGLVPLIPYFFVTSVVTGLWISSVVMAIALFVFGYGKTAAVVGRKGYRAVRKSLLGGIQMIVVGGVAAVCAMGLVRFFDDLAGGA
ncbi:hypothetical protein DL546_009507 [Coniochaeta pulveracea]|uniref:DUF125-domain-containing protein n=1 Tax=Coniochaeta pulveracea TaxID=177199 RepID=A0A420YLK9_9PEZI|nr:hypothetical protein DL546_009507 [Coniochaeta pulveracea]